jgi:ankyrin repeat protein
MQPPKLLVAASIVLLQSLAFAARSQLTGSPAAGAKRPDIFQAIRSGDSLQVQRLLAQGADVNDSLDGFTVLMAATLCGTPAEMKWLIDRGARVNYANSDGMTALWLALPDPVRTGILLDHGAKAQAISKEGYNPLVKLALMPGTVDLFRLLIAAGADPRKSGPDNTLLYNAAASGDTAILGLLLRAGLSANDTLFYGDYPITGALFYRQSSAVKMLVAAGARVNVHPSHVLLDQLNGFTPLMWAALIDDTSSFYLLLDHGADPNLRNDRGYTAMMLLQQAERDEPDMTLALIRHGAIANMRAPDGTDALSLAKMKGNTRSVALLKQYVK